MAITSVSISPRTVVRRFELCLSGTQARKLVDERNMVQLSTGDMLRAARTSGTEMGKKVAAVMDRGELVTDEIVIGLIREQLESGHGGGGYIFDGFPRTLAQADALGALLNDLGENLDCVIEMQVDDEALVARITARSTCGSCGEVYNDNTKPIPADGNRYVFASHGSALPGIKALNFRCLPPTGRSFGTLSCRLARALSG